MTELPRVCARGTVQNKIPPFERGLMCPCLADSNNITLQYYNAYPREGERVSIFQLGETSSRNYVL